MALFDVALAWHQAGASVVPAASDGSKAPAVAWKPYEAEPAEPAQLAAWFADNAYDGLGLVCGAVSGNLEMFELEGRAVHLFVDLGRLFADHGQAGLWTRLNRGYLEVTPSGGFHWLYRVDGPARRNIKLARRPATADELAVNPDDKIKVLIETRGEGGFVVVAPSNGRTHPTGKPWVVVAGGIPTVPNLTVNERDTLYGLASMLDQMPAAVPAPATASSNGSAPGGRPGDDYNTRTDWQDILTSWTRVNRIGDGYGWRRPGKDRGISATTGTSSDGVDRLYVFSTSTQFATEMPYSKFGAYTLLEHGGDHSGAARALRLRGYGHQPEPARPVDPRDLIAPTTQPVQSDAVATADDPELHRSQVRIAERFTVTHGSELRYAHGLGWLGWDGTRWRGDRDGAPIRAVITTLKQAIAQADTELAKDIRKAETAPSLHGILSIATCLHPFTVPAEDLDPDPHLLNCHNGTLDLRTGTLRPHDRADLITKVTGCGYDPDAHGPTFEKFIGEVLPDEQVRGYVQRLLGQALAGKVTEHVLPIFTGVGCNGKTTLIELVLQVFGDYGLSAESELLVEHGPGRHPTGQSDLLSMRLAITQETDEGRRLAAATVKRLTGGDKIRARKMHKDFFEFTPSHTVLMVTNHKPKVSGDDPALWRRLQVVPFDVVVADPDTALPDRLSLELPAVLSWLVKGYQEYQQKGLAPPVAVSERTKEYLDSSDTLGRFLDERTLASTHAHVKARELFSAWSGWCQTNGEVPGSEVIFAAAMTRRGFEKAKRVGVMTYLGLMIAAEDQETE